MKVKEIKEMQEVVVRTEYIASDGKVFYRLEDCEEWERSYKCTITESFNKIPYVEMDGESSYLQCGIPEDIVRMVKPRNMEDINIINSYGETVCGWNPKLTHEDIGEVIMIDLGDEYDKRCNAMRVSKYLEDIEKTYKEIEVQLNEKE